MAIKILVDAHVFDGIHQGSRTYLKGLYSGFSDSRFEIFFAGNDIENLKKEFPQFEDKNFIKLQSKNKFIRLALEYPYIIQKYRFDYAHFNYILPLFKPKDCRYINTLHDVLFLDFPEYFSKNYILKNKFLFKRSIKSTDVLLTVSKYSRDRIAHHFKVPSSEISVTTNAVNTVFSSSIDKSLSKKLVKEKYKISKYILFVSRIEPRKNHIGLLQAFIDLKLYEEGYTLVFSGRKEGIDKALDNKILELKAHSETAFIHIENLSQEELIHFYNAAEACVFPSFCEGFGIPPLESGCLRTKTLCSDQTAMSEFTFFENNHFNPNNKNELEKKLKDILSTSRADLNSISSKITEQYDWKKSRTVLIERLIKDHKEAAF